jgi:hypothetical protein
VDSERFRGRIVFIVAGGPSVTVSGIRSVALARAKGAASVIAVNDAVYPCWFADHLHSCDRRWWIEHDGVPGFPRAKSSIEETPFPDVWTLRNTGKTGFDPEPGNLRTGSNSGYQACHLAASFGAAEIVLFGLDFTDGGARDHWFGRHRPPFDKNSDVVAWRRMLRDLTEELGRRGISVFRAGSHSTLTWLPQFDLST